MARSRGTSHGGEGDRTEKSARNGPKLMSKLPVRSDLGLVDLIPARISVVLVDEGDHLRHGERGVGIALVAHNHGHRVLDRR